MGDPGRRPDEGGAREGIGYHSGRMFILYEGLLLLVFVLTLPFFLLLGVMRGKYLANFPERMGFYRTPAERHDLWVHAVSVGEVLASRPVVEEIVRQRPGTSIVFTTTTITGQAQARRLFPEASVTYFPFDFAWSVNRFLRHHEPRVFATMETEIWPNVIRLSKRRGIGLVLANGRISDRSFPKYRALRLLLRGLLGRYDRILAREETDRERFVAIGAPSAIVETTGNVKFDYEPDGKALEVAAEIERLIAGRKVLVFGSTIEGEDELLLPVIERLIAERNVFVIVVPRKPERFDLVAGLLGTMNLRAVRRSELSSATAGDVLLLDSFGELARLYRYATAAFVGGSLVPHGGHNPIEPAADGVPVSFGPSMSNFREIARVFLRNEAAMEAGSAEEVGAFMRRMVDDELLQRAWGERARQTVLQNRGASERTARRIVELLP